MSFNYCTGIIYPKFLFDNFISVKTFNLNEMNKENMKLGLFKNRLTRKLKC